MNLKEWLDENGIKRSAFAKLVDVGPPTISRIIGGDRVPSRELIIRIHDVTKGEVTWKDWPSQRKATGQPMAGSYIS
jgi:plasmid maintenance system antidote protein VapI